LETGGITYSLAGLIAGLLFMYIIGKITNRSSRGRALNTGVLLLFGIALHNFPEGVAIGAAYANNSTLAASLLLIITVHDIPEGISIFAPLYAGGIKTGKILLLIALSGLPTGIGAFVGGWAGSLGAAFNSSCLSFAAGAMLYICVGELSFEARELYNRKIIAAGYILGLVTGMLL
jgi:ZIP family zinc transporter